MPDNCALIKLSTYTVLTSVSIACIAVMESGEKSQKFVDGAFAAVATYAALGFLSTATCNEFIEELHCCATKALPFLVLPCLATELWLKHNPASKEAAYAHAGLGLLMVLITAVWCVSSNIKGFIIFANAASIAYVGWKSKNYNALVAAVIFPGAELSCIRCDETERENLYNILLAAFSYFALMSVVPPPPVK